MEMERLMQCTSAACVLIAGMSLGCIRSEGRSETASNAFSVSPVKITPEGMLCIGAGAEEATVDVRKTIPDFEPRSFALDGRGTVLVVGAEPPGAAIVSVGQDGQEHWAVSLTCNLPPVHDPVDLAWIREGLVAVLDRGAGAVWLVSLDSCQSTLFADPQTHPGIEQTRFLIVRSGSRVTRGVEPFPANGFILTASSIPENEWAGRFAESAVMIQIVDANGDGHAD